VHAHALDLIRIENPKHEEQEPVAVRTGLGEGRQSEFTLPGSFGQETRGYRATFLTRDRRITVTCSCPEAEFEKLKPAFERVINSLRPGSGR
jgi:hypothetical protein